MGLFQFKQYKYKQSFEVKTKQKNVEITEKYEALFLKIISKEKLSKEEELLLSYGIEDVKLYILHGVFFKMTEDYNSKTLIEKKAETLFNQLSKIYAINSFDRMLEEFEDLAIDSIYEALGFDINKECFNKTTESSYFLKYSQSILFYKILNYLEKSTNAYKSEIDNYKESYEEENLSEEIEMLLEESNLKRSLPQDILEELKEALLNKECPKHLKPYFIYLESLKLSL